MAAVADRAVCLCGFWSTLFLASGSRSSEKWIQRYFSRAAHNLQCDYFRHKCFSYRLDGTSSGCNALSVVFFLPFAFFGSVYFSIYPNNFLQSCSVTSAVTIIAVHFTTFVLALNDYEEID